MHPARAGVNGSANASDLFQETFEEAKHHLGERHEQHQAHLHRHVQALSHMQHAGKPTRCAESFCTRLCWLVD